jgi:hypothetical protein
MILLSRVNRLEQRHSSGNPFDDLTDDEIEAAIEALNKQLADALGTSGNGMVDIPVDLDEGQLRSLVAHIKWGSRDA